MTNTNMNLAAIKEAYDEARIAYEKAKEEAADAIIDTINNTGEPMILTDVTNAIGLPRGIVRNLMEKHCSYYEHDFCKPLQKKRVTVYRKYALIDSEGNVDTSKTINVPIQELKYFPRKEQEEKPTNIEEKPRISQSTGGAGCDMVRRIIEKYGK